ncbi:uncharacterized protein LY89DRAFT_686518 [Mollisia scopiformis]|uniref:Uncharacterized protein n=1 Tax=Mollisia scopiformis TaxID=149040 RepID=A0A194X546_MOLSC|nr:uncharacterized protein LY89DRAFT_686518 [Mollisia scopiformis]KUJ14922.1 hypothetical protein LY89DRAFT_686518 [Mollisia scopiformis]
MTTPTSSNPVSWASLFWGLLPFAINSMTQPSGLVCGADADVGFLLRSSPIICFLDTMLILIRFTSYYFSSGSFCEARNRLVRFRFNGEHWTEFKEAKRKGGRTAQKNEQILRFLLFVLAISQFIKIFAYEGVIWSKVIAALYLGSFLVTELLVVWHAVWMTDIADLKEEYPTIIPYGSIAVAVAFMLWFASVAARDIFGHPHHTLPQWAAGVIGTLGAGLAIPALGYSFRHCKTWRQVRGSAALLLFVLGSPVGFYFTGQIIPATIPIIWIQVVAAALAAVWVSIALLYASQATRTVRARGKERQRKKVEQVTAWYFFLLHFSTALLFYLFSYDPQGTSTPRWTQCLG